VKSLLPLYNSAVVQLNSADYTTPKYINRCLTVACSAAVPHIEMTTSTAYDRLPTVDPDTTSNVAAMDNNANGKDEAGTLPTPVFEKGRYRSPWLNWQKPSLWGAIHWTLTSPDNSRVPSPQVLDKTLPVVKPDLELLRDPPTEGVRVTWFGHATVLVQMDGVSVLTDPVFSERASPVPFAGPKRFRPAPCSVQDLPTVDAVIISHNHFDHLDKATVKQLNKRFGADLRWLVPQGMASWFWDLHVVNVAERSWWEESRINNNSDVRFVFTPTQHWSKRTLTNDNMSLWGSWCVIGPRHRFFFAGDTAYCPVFKTIGEKFGPFDLAAIPIGAYEPRWFMHYQHVDPEQAVMMHRDVRASKSVAIHWGTFALANEYYLEPPQKLQEALQAQGVPAEDFFTLQHGESRQI